MLSRYDILRDLDPYKGDKKLIVRRQDSFQIIDEIMRVHRLSADQYDRIADKYWTGDVYGTGRKLFEFLKLNVPYNEEGMYKQSVKHPAAIIAEAPHKGGDCKHYASYIVGVTDALRRKGYPISSFYRFGAYNLNEPDAPGHVFAVLIDENGREIWADPVLPQYNVRHPRYINNWDKYPTGVKVGAIGALYEISGIQQGRELEGGGHEYVSLGNIHHDGERNRDWLHQWYGDGGGDAMGKAKKKKHHRLKIRIPKVKLKIQPGQFLKKFLGAVPRNAFLALMKVNALSLATDLAAAANKGHKSKIDAFWKKVGGNPNKLHTAINQGVGHYNSIHKAHQVSHMAGLVDNNLYGPLFRAYVAEPQSDQEAAIGVAGGDDAAEGGLLAAAAPLMVEFNKLLKELGISKPDLNGKVDKASKDLIAKHNDKVDGDEHDDDGTVTHDGGVTTTVTTDPQTGQQTMTVGMTDQAIKSAQGDGTPTGSGEDTGEDTEEDTGDDSKAVKKAGGSGGGLKDFFIKAESWVGANRNYILMGTAAIAGGTILYKVLTHKKKGRR